jgi:hypothetical protein
MTNNPIDALDATKFIQRIIEERDEALARNRELEAENERAVRDQVDIMAQVVAKSVVLRETQIENAKLQEQISILATHMQLLEEEKSGLETIFNNERTARQEAEVQRDTAIVENQTLKSLARDWQKLMQDWDDMPMSAPVAAFVDWGAKWKLLVLCTDAIAKEEKHVD